MVTCNEDGASDEMSDRPDIDDVSGVEGDSVDKEQHTGQHPREVKHHAQPRGIIK